MSYSDNQYVGKIPGINSTKPKFTAVVDAVTRPIVQLQLLIQGYPLAYDLDFAVGTQLDVVGQWIGVSRNIAIPIVGVYFSFDEEGVGFDQGVWYLPFDPVSGLTKLDDDTYRILLRAKIAADNWDGSVAGAKAVYSDLFGVDSPSLVFIQDNGDMTMTVGVSGQIPSAIATALLTDGTLDLKPGAVRISSYEITSVEGAPLFGFDVENEYISGFDVGAWGIGSVGEPNGSIDVPTLQVVSITVT